MPGVTMIRAIEPLRAILVRAKWWRANRPATGKGAIWALNGTLLLTAVVLFWAAARDAQPIIPGIRLPLWALVIGFAAGERFVVHVHFRRSAHTLSLGEIPLVFGLIFASGQNVVLAGVLGPLVVMALHRKMPPIKLAFNLGQFAVGNCIAVIVFHAVAGSAGSVDAVVWVATGLAVAANSLIASLLITTAVSVTEGGFSLRLSLRTLATDFTVAAANTSVALCAATLAIHSWKAALLMVIPAAAIFAVHRAYLVQRERQKQLELLYEAARTLSGSAEVGPALERLLARTLEDFRVETAQLILFSPTTQAALCTVVRADGPGQMLEELEPNVAGDLRILAERHRSCARATSEIAEGRVADYVSSHALAAGMFATLNGDNGLFGAFLLGDPSSELTDAFSEEDLKPFETLVNNISVALQNDRLANAVWEMRALQQELAHKASHDPLTELANRSVFGDSVREALEGGRGRISVIFIDIDDFKTINDSLGHAAGDELLVAVSRRLEDCVRPTDLVARIGGDEFGVMLDQTCSEDEAVEITKRIIDCLSERVLIAGEPVTIGASAGIATCERDGLSSEELIRDADLAMYQAKRGGKHSYAVFEPGMEVATLKRHRVKQRLRDGVDRRSFVAHYQPIVALDTGEVVAHEALVRWVDGPNGTVQPRSFIPVAEETGMIVPIGQLVLNQACEDARGWKNRSTKAPAVHVNVSPVELLHPDFLGGVTAALEQSGLIPEQLVFEVTENVAMHTPERTVEILHELRDMGPRIALDDFGTGYSSLSRLRRLPVDLLKVGPPVLTGAEQDVDGPLVTMVLSLADSLGCQLIVEGIESERQRDELLALGCEFGQGFYLGRPAELMPSTTGSGGGGSSLARVPQLSSAA